MFKYRKVLKYLNRAVYVMSAVMMMAGLALTVTTKPVSAAEVVNQAQSGLSAHVDVSGNSLLTGGDHHECNDDEKEDDNGNCVTKTPKPTKTATATKIATATKTATTAKTATAFNTATAANTAIFTATASNTPESEATKTPANTATATASNTPADTATATASNTPEPTATETPTNTATATATNTPTNTATNTATPTDTATNTATATITNTPTITPNTLYILLLDPYCVSIPGDLMQWSVINNNEVPFNVLSWSIDGVMQAGGFVAPVGESPLTQTSLGTHTIVLYWEQQGFTQLTYGPLSCQLPDTATPIPTNTRVAPNNTPVPNTATTVPTLPIPETGGAGGPIIPVTGADLNGSVNSWFFGGFGMFGFGLVLSGLRKMFNL